MRFPNSAYGTSRCLRRRSGSGGRSARRETHKRYPELPIPKQPLIPDAMPTLETSDLEMHYVVDDFTDPWTKPETILLLHGNAESSLAWYAWVPHLARRYRVVRADRRGYGESSPMPSDYEWTFDVLIDDHVQLMDAL